MRGLKNPRTHNKGIRSSIDCGEKIKSLSFHNHKMTKMDDDLSLLSFGGVSEKKQGAATTTGRRTAGDDHDDTFFINPPDGVVVDASGTDDVSYGVGTDISTTNNKNPSMANLSVPEEEVDSSPKMNRPSIISDFIGAALSLSSGKMGKSSSTHNVSTSTEISKVGSASGNKIRQDVMDDEDNPLVLSVSKKDSMIHELLREQREEILKEVRKEVKQQRIDIIAEMNEALASGSAPNPRQLRFSIFSPTGGMNYVGGGGEQDSDDAGESRQHALEEDVYSLMMLNSVRNEEQMSLSPFWRRVKRYSQRLCLAVGILAWMNLISDVFFGRAWIDFTHWSRQDEYIMYLLSFVPFWWAMSSPWFLGLVTFLAFQLFLGFSIIADQLMGTKQLCERNKGRQEVCIPFDIPINFDPIVSVVQAIAGILVLATQMDILTSILNILHLKNADHVPWDRVIGVEGNRTWSLWMTRILLPNALKFIQAFVILVASFIIIIQSEIIVDLLKDCTAVLFVSQSDNIIFSVAGMGYLGSNLARKTAEVKAVHWTNELEEEKVGLEHAELEEGNQQSMFEVPGADNETHGGCFSSFCRRIKRTFHFRVFIFGLLCVIMIGGIFFIKLLQFHGIFATMKYPNCIVRKPSLVGDGYCHDWFPINTEACGFDGGDCGDRKQVDGYPDCFVSNTFRIGDGECQDWPPYNTPECGFDGGDCGDLKEVDGYPDCFVHNPWYIGNGFCDGDFPLYNTPECGFDGGDCDDLEPVVGYPNCFVLYPESLGNGECYQYPPYNTPECGFDGGDCI